MESNETITVVEAVPAQHRLAKMLLGTTAAFLATLAVEKVYDKLLERKSDTPEIDPK